MSLMVETELRTFTCGRCGGLYAIGEKYAQFKQEKGGFWHCPYCECSWGYPVDGCELTVAKRQKAEAEAKLAREKAAHDQSKAELKNVGIKLAKEANKTRRLKTRIAKGVCPCCHRTVSQLARHMATKHPEYAAESKP